MTRSNKSHKINGEKVTIWIRGICTGQNYQVHFGLLPFFHYHLFFPAEFDEGEGLKKLLEAEKELFKNNFPQVALAHAASSIEANYDLVVNEFDGCATPVLKGQPVSGKTTALKAVMSVFGEKHFTSVMYHTCC